MFLKILKYWVGVQWGQSYLLGRRWLFSLIWPHPFSDGVTVKISYWVDVFFLKKKTLWPLFMDADQLPQSYSHFEEAVYFLPLSSQKFLVLILSISEGWKAESTLDPKVLNTGPLDWESSTLTTWSLLHFTTLSSLAPHLFLFGWLKLNLTLLLDQLRDMNTCGSCD